MAKSFVEAKQDALCIGVCELIGNRFGSRRPVRPQIPGGVTSGDSTKEIAWASGEISLESCRRTSRRVDGPDPCGEHCLRKAYSEEKTAQALVEVLVISARVAVIESAD